MSVPTAADEKLASALGHIREAVKDLSGIVIDECHGVDDFRGGYKETVFSAMRLLIEVKEQLDTQ